MSLTLALNNALSGLNVNQFALSTVSNNIANANTQGYSRQIVEQSARILNGVGAGVKVDDIARKIDQYLERSIQRETSNVGYADEINEYYSRIQILLGEPGANNSIDRYIESFFNSLQSLAETPDRTSFRATAVDTGVILAREISGLATALEDLRYQADQDISEAINYINSELRHLDSLNVAINRAWALGTSTAGLLDQRDQALKNISEYMDIEVNVRESGAVDVYTANGVALVDDFTHELTYRTAAGVNTFINDGALNPIQVVTYDERGRRFGEPVSIISSGMESSVTSKLNSGKLQALHEVRDTLIPDILSQLDMLASRLRDQVNAIHNDGSGYPGASDLSGTRLVTANEAFNWSGEVMIAVLNQDGTPAASTYMNELYTGYRPLVLDLESLNSGGANGVPTIQTLIDEINNHFNAPPVKAQVGNLSNIQLVSNNQRIPQGVPASFSFDFDLDNLDGFGSEFFVSGVRVLDDTATDISNVTDTIPRVTIDQANAFNFTAGSSQVTITTLGNHGLGVGDQIYLEDSGLVGNINGVDASELSGYFKVVSVGPGINQFVVEVGAVANTSGPVAAANPMDGLPAYHNLDAGNKQRTRDSGLFTADLSANPTSAYYDIEVDVGVYAGDPPVMTTSTVRYRIQGGTAEKLNDRFDTTGVTGQGAAVFPTSPHQYIFAKLVDENGRELPKINGSYGDQQGYLQLVTNDLNGNEFTISINELDSKQLGKLDEVPPQAGTNRGFSHFFELNNFFESNKPTTTGDTVNNSAINLSVEQRLRDNPNLITTGELVRSAQPTDPNAKPIYTYERYNGDNSVVQRLAKVGITAMSFDAAGGLPTANLSLNGYTGEMLGFIATKTAMAQNSLTDTLTLLSGFESRADAISGVNMDEELANMIIFQNAYTASARVITVTDQLFEELLNMI